MKADSIDKNVLRRGKEFVYEQWRKLLCISVLGHDVSTNQFPPQEVTAEKIRTIFDNGYKLAMLQTKASLKQELSICLDSNQVKVFDRLLTQIEDRLVTHKCLVAYGNHLDESMYKDALKRDAEFLHFAKEDVTQWAGQQM